MGLRKSIKKIKTRITKILEKIDEKLEKFKLSDRVYWIFVGLLFGWLLFQLVYFAVNVRYNIIPDEIHHYKVIHFYLGKKDLLPFISDQGGQFFFGELTRNPSYLYHYIASLLLRIPGFLQREFLVLRTFSIVMSAASFVTFVMILEELTNRKYLKLLSIFIYTNTLMLVFTGMGISYDVPLNLMSLISILLLIKIFKTYEIKYLLIFFIVGFFSSLIKFTYAPLFFIQTIFILGAYINAGKFNIRELMREAWQMPKWLLGLIVIIGLLSFGLFAEKYLVNLVKYQALVPACEEIHTHEECMQNGVYERNYYFKADPGPDRYMSMLVFIPRYAIRAAETVFGLTAHLDLGVAKVTAYGMLAIFAAGVILFLNSKLKGKNRFYVVLMSISVFYIGVVMANNYFFLSEFGWFGVALQGRYIFPVYPIFLFLTNFYLFDFLKYRLLKIIYTMFLVIILVTGGFMYFMRNAGPEWFGPDDSSQPWAHLE
ncbi:hypothetical protein GF357_02455 [Candidatus Dojkabacteria bacterium]|nr:hypothetical protein [Candidatus Dojkabacteria bacterium]